MSLLRFIRHLRLPFQFVLAPVFLLGFALSEASPSISLVVVFLLIHVGLYGGATAYNSYYDRDEGPIGGMKYPPGVGVQGVAVLAIGVWDWRLGVVGTVMLGMGVAYSHPRWRWKARPWWSLLTVTLGQGILPFIMGWWTGGGEAMEWPVWMAWAATALLITGFYPLTQVYQIEEDRGRGDISFAVRFGPEGVFRTARLLVGAGATLFGIAVWQGGILQESWLVGIPLGYVAFLWALRRWERVFGERDEYENHDWAFAVCAGMAGAFWVLVLVELVY
jgi:1,4-dihydroxy-2-naphthoate octaprenyltransferase